MTDSVKLKMSHKQGISFNPILSQKETILCIKKLDLYLSILTKMCKRKNDGLVVNYISRCTSKLNNIKTGINYSNKPSYFSDFIFFSDIGVGSTPNKVEFEDLAYIIDNLLISLSFIVELNGLLDNKDKNKVICDSLKLFLNDELLFTETIKTKISLEF